MTTNEYLTLPETVTPQELAFGVMHVRESPSAQHQRMVAQLFLALHAHLRSQPCGEVWLAPLDVILDEGRALVVQPDLFVVTGGTKCVVDARVWGPPDLVIEILSPQSRVGDVRDRIQWFAEYGVRECWITHLSDRAVAVIAFADGGIRSRRRYERGEPVRSDVLPAFDASFDSIVGGY